MTISNWGGFRVAARALACGLGVSTLLSVAAPGDAHAADRRVFPANAVVKVYINWQSFTDSGFTEFTYEQVRDAVINAYTHWQHTGGANVRYDFIGQTTRDPGVSGQANANEVIVKANEMHPAGSRLASTFGCADVSACTQIVVHRKVSNGTTNVFNLWGNGTNSVGSDLQAVLTHETGHSFGLFDHDATDGTTMFPTYRFNQRFGPYRSDRDRLIGLYGAEQDVKVRALESTDTGVTWSTLANLPAGLHTTQDLDGVRDASTLVLFYTNQDKHPCWIVGNNLGTFDTNKWYCYGGSESWYGTSGDGEDGEYMFSYVSLDANGLVPSIKVVYSTTADLANGGGVLRTPANARTYGTPSVAKLGANSWVLSYSKFDPTSTAHGQVVARVTTNDGASWSGEVLLTDVYRAEAGVSVTGNQSNGNVRVGFSWAAGSTGTPFDFPSRTLFATLSGSTLTYDNAVVAGARTRTQPSLTRAASSYFESHRETNTQTSAAGGHMSLTGSAWSSDYNNLSGTTNMATSPGIAGDKDFNFVYLFHAI